MGSGLAGTLGEPVHFGTGDVAVGLPGALHLRNAAPSAVAGIFLSLSEGTAFFKGGILKAVPFFGLFILNTDANGDTHAADTNPDTDPDGDTDSDPNAHPHPDPDADRVTGLGGRLV